MLDVLEQDPRPAFVLNLHEYVNPASEACLNPLFFNLASREQPGLLAIIRGQSSPVDYGQPSASTYATFARWCTPATSTIRSICTDRSQKNVSSVSPDTVSLRWS